MINIYQIERETPDNKDNLAAILNLREGTDVAGFTECGRVCYIAGNAFPGSPNVRPKALPKGKRFTSSHLMKNDLNGHFLTDQPGQPFKGDPGNTAGSDLPPP